MSELKTIEPLILTLRGQKVILDAGLAKAYGVKTKRLNEQVKRNRNRFPEDLMKNIALKRQAGSLSYVRKHLWKQDRN